MPVRHVTTEISFALEDGVTRLQHHLGTVHLDTGEDISIDTDGNGLTIGRQGKPSLRVEFIDLIANLLKEGHLK